MLFTPHLWMPKAAAGAFVGAGDIAGGASGYWGLRAYTVASIGSNAIKLRRDSDNTTQTFVTVSGGGLDLSSISTFKTTANLFVDTLYDQTGNGNNLVQATQAKQPQFTLSGLGSLPIMSFVSGSDLNMQTSTLMNFSAPFTWVCVGRRTSNFTTTQCMISSSPNTQLAFNSVANQIYNYNGGSVPTATASDSTYHAFGSLFATTSILSVDGSTSTGAAGTGSISNQKITIGDYISGGTNALDGQLLEAAVYASDISSSLASLSSNEHSYWGF